MVCFSPSKEAVSKKILKNTNINNEISPVSNRSYLPFMNPRNKKKAAVFIFFLYQEVLDHLQYLYANQRAFVLPSLKSTFLKAINFQ